MTKFFSVVSLGCGLLSTVSAYALTCENMPSCAELGYSKNIPAACTKVIQCPFDTSYKKCLNCDLTSPGNGGGSGGSDDDSGDGEGTKTCTADYNISESDKQIKENNGYTCTACNDNGTTKYKCLCVSPKTEHDDGKCYDCADENDPNRPNKFKGGYTCSGDRIPIPETYIDTCDTIRYYRDCYVEEKCLFNNGDLVTSTTTEVSFGDDRYEVKNTNKKYGSGLGGDGYEVIKLKCTSNSDPGKSIYYVRPCDAKQIDSFIRDLGFLNAPGTVTMKGLKTCRYAGGTYNGSTTGYQCGGKEWFDTCPVDSCQYYDGTDCVNGRITGMYLPDTNYTRLEYLAKSDYQGGDGREVVAEKCQSTIYENKYLYYVRLCDAPADSKFNRAPYPQGFGDAGSAYGLKNCNRDKGTYNGSSEGLLCGGKRWFNVCDGDSDDTLQDECKYYDGTNCTSADGKYLPDSNYTRLEYLAKSDYQGGNGREVVAEKCQSTINTSKHLYYVRLCDAPANSQLNRYVYPLGEAGSAYGLKNCTRDNGTYNGSSEGLLCGNKKWFDTCYGDDDTCKFTDPSTGRNGNTGAVQATEVKLTDYRLEVKKGHKYYGDGTGALGYMVVEKKCDSSINESISIYRVKSCTAPADSTYTGNFGAAGPAVSLKQCTDATPIPDPNTEPVYCGGYTYSKKCYASCPYDDTEESCAAQGKEFTAKCDDGTTTFGICK